ncbi:hypothetical protein [Geminicoccus flavidas]|uniref:hypothetical protein n=1 Tax=Geminicoccus flavidas TaxID=2506407 RepID=UPI00135C3651|nr:hypothetical protein [Geminicoccus flavidas]
MATYEEIRDIVVDLLQGQERTEYPNNQFEHLKYNVAAVLARRENRQSQRHPALNELESELTRDVFWDLFRQGYITLGSNNANPNWPFFRLSHHGQQAITSGRPWRFHSAESYLQLVRAQVPSLDDLTAIYLEEAVSSFYADCILACCVMLGVASENEFLNFLSASTSSSLYSRQFTSIQSERTILRKIDAFRRFIAPIARGLPNQVGEDIETNFQGVQSLIRFSRNEAGHPQGDVPSREHVYVLLQLFIPYAQKVAALKSYFPTT